MRTERQVERLSRSAFKLFSVQFSYEIDIRGILHLCRAIFDFHLFGNAFAHAVDFGVHVGVRNSILIFVDFYTLVIADFHVGFYGRYGNENDFFFGNIFHRKRGFADRRKLFLFFFENFSVVFAVKQVQRVFIKKTFAVIQFENVLGRLPLAESVDRILAARLNVSLIVRLFPFFGRERNRNFYRAFFGCRHFVLHVFTPVPILILYISFYHIKG